MSFVCLERIGRRDSQRSTHRYESFEAQRMMAEKNCSKQATRWFVLESGSKQYPRQYWLSWVPHELLGDAVSGFETERRRRRWQRQRPAPSAQVETFCLDAAMQILDLSLIVGIHDVSFFILQPCAVFGCSCCKRSTQCSHVDSNTHSLLTVSSRHRARESSKTQHRLGFTWASVKRTPVTSQLVTSDMSYLVLTVNLNTIRLVRLD